MPKIILFPSPFRSDRTFHTVEPGTTVREAVALTKPSAHFPGALLVLNDRQVDISDQVMGDEDTLIVRAVPAGGVGDAISKAGSEAWKVMSQMAQNPFLVVTGLFLIGGAMTFLYSLGSSAVSSVIPKPPHFDTSTTNGSLGLHGGRNAMKPYQQVPVILGKSIIAPPLGSKVYTDWDGSNPAKQILSQVFVVGMGRLAITAMKIGDRALTDFGVTPTASVQTLTNDTYGKIVTEAGVGIELKASASQIQVSVADIDAMSLDICFPSGLCSYNSNGDRTTSRTIDLTVEYKKTSTGSWAGAASFALSYAENFTQAITKKADITQAMLNAAGRAGYTGTWDVRITRSTADATDSKYIDRSTWSVLRSIQLKEPMSAAAKGITTRIALTIQATDQLNGAVDNFNCEAQSVVPCYDGIGSGASDWNGATALGYPATWKNVNMTTGGYTWNTWTGNATSNPAALYLWILRGPANPKPVPDTLIDWPAFEAWYTFCVSKGLEVNAVWDQGGAMLDLLDKIAGVGRAASMMRDSKYSVIFDQPQSVPVQHFTPRNSRNFSASKAFPTPVHAIRSQFIDKDSAWKQAEQIVYMAGYSAGTATEFRTQQLWGVTNYQQAYKAIFYQVAVETLRPEIYQMEVDFEHLACQRGDLVAVSHDVLLYGLQAARVVSLTINGGGQALTVTLDEDVTMEVGKSYGLRWRRMDGTSVVAPVNLAVGTTRTLTFTSPVVVGSVPEVDDLCSFGESGSETQMMLVVSIEMADEFSARVTLNNYDPAVYTADSGAIPAWSSGISLPPPVGYGELPDLSVPSTGPADPPPVFLPRPVYPSASKIYAHWSYDELPVSPAYLADIRDVSGNGRNSASAGGGIVVNGTDGGSPWASKQVRSGMGLRSGGGTSVTNRAYAAMGIRTDYPDASGQFWVSHWFEIPSDFDAVTQQQGIIGHNSNTSGGLTGTDTTGQGWQFTMNADRTTHFRHGKPGVAATIYQTTALSVGLHHLIFDYRADGPEWWLDGALVYKAPASTFYGDLIGTLSGLTALTHNIRIGTWQRANPSGSRNFRGYHDETILGTGNLTDAEKLALYALLPGPQLSSVKDQISITAPKYLGKYLDSAPTPGNTGDTYTRYSTTSGATNRGVFRWNGVSWDRTEAVADISQAISDISFIIAYKNAAGVAIYGVAADYSGDSTIQASFAFFTSAMIGFLEAQDIKVRGSIVIGDRYDSTGAVVDATKDGMYLPKTGLGKMAGIAFEGSRGGGVQWGGGQQVGASFTLPNVDAPYRMAFLTGQDIALVRTLSGTAVLATYRFSGTAWALVGTALTLSGTVGGAMSITALNSTDIAMVDSYSSKLSTYRFNPSTGLWSLVGSQLTLTSVSLVSLAALNSTDVAYLNSGNATLSTYRFNGSTWSLVGSALTIASIGGSMAISALGPKRIAKVDGTTGLLGTYEFSGSAWSLVGSTLSLGSVNPACLAAINGTDVAYVDGVNDQLRVYRFDESTWGKVASAGSPIIGAGQPALAAMGGTDVAFADDINKQLRTYRFAFALSVPYHP